MPVGAIAAAVLVVAGSLWIARTGPPPGANEGNDLRVFLEGAEGFAMSGNPYGTGYVSPPPFALLIQPLRLLPPDAAALIWLILGVLATVGAVVMAVAISNTSQPAFVVAATSWLVLAWPAHHYGLELGQSSAIVGFLLLGGVVAARPSPATAGVLLAVAGVLKPHLTVPLLLGLALDEWAVRRRQGVAIAFVLFGGCLVGAVWLYSPRWVEVLMNSPPESWNYWGSTIGLNVALSWLLADQAAGWLLVGAISVWVVAALAVWRCRSQPDLAQFAAAVLAATLLITPYAYPHDYILLVLPLVWVVCRLLPRRYLWSAAVVAGLVVMVWVAPVPALYTESRFAALAVPAVLLGLVIGIGPGGNR